MAIHVRLLVRLHVRSLVRFPKLWNVIACLHCPIMSLFRSVHFSGIAFLSGWSEWDKGLACCSKCFGKAFERFHGNIVHAALKQTHGGGVTASSGGELLLSQTKGTTTETDLRADPTVRSFLWCWHVREYPSTKTDNWTQSGVLYFDYFFLGPFPRCTVNS